MRGIISAGGYVPFRRLQRTEIAKTFGSGGGKGTRSVASYDEDTTTMGVEAARLALRGAPSGAAPDALWFATASPAYLDKNNASTLHAALRLDTAVSAFDFGGALRSGIGVLRAALDGDRSATVGNTGSAHAALLLADTLESAQPGQVIGLVVLADGADVLLFRTTDAIASYAPARTVAAQIGGAADLPYGKFLSWRGEARLEPPRRPEPDRISASVSGRTEEWKYAFVGSRDRGSGELHMPPARIPRVGD